MGRYVFIGLLFIIFFSCKDTGHKGSSKSDVDQKLYTLQGEGWKSKRVSHLAGDIQYRATQVPVEYYLLKSLQDNQDSITSLARDMANERIVEMEFEHFGKSDLLEQDFTGMDYDRSVSYMANTIQGDFMAVTQTGDTIPCSGVHFERHFKVSPFKRVILYFGGIPQQQPIQVIYNDRLFGNGIFKFSFDQQPFKS